MTRAAEVEVDGAWVAQRLGLPVDEFRRLMDARRITVLCERGTGADLGRYRATFYHGGRRARLVIEPDGRIGDSVD